MVLQECKIKFTNPVVPVFVSGDVVSGVIYITLQKEKKLTDLAFHAKGETKVSWSESRGSGKNRRTVTYHAEETYFRIITSLLTTYPREDNLVTLPPGEHSFSFEFRLPENIPSSLEGHYGRTRYSVKVVAIRPWKFDDTFKQPMSVVSKYDLNLNQICARPLAREIKKELHFFFSSRGGISLKLSVPQTGFVSGQTIPINCELVNNTRVKIPMVRFKLAQVKTYTATHPHTKSREDRNPLVQVSGKGADKEETVSYVVNIEIPPIPPSSQYSTLIKIEYYLKVTIVISGMHRNSEDHVPIVIGTIPLYNPQAYTVHTNGALLNPGTFPTAPQQNGPSAPSTSLDTPSNNVDAPPSYNSLAPPSYAECRYSGHMIQAHPNDRSICEPYKPFYPVYNFPPLPKGSSTYYGFC